MELPVPILVPVPHPSSYHIHDADVPRLPPATVSVTLLPRQIPFTGALLLAEDGAVEEV
jgi:hypothetical protein